MGIVLKFLQDDTATDVEVTVRAKSGDVEAERIMRILQNEPKDVLLGDALSDEKEIDVEKIVLLSKSGRYVSVKTTDVEYVLKEPLYKIEEKLDKNRFVRISQSEIVHLKHVLGWSFDGGGIIKIELVNGISSYTSRRYAVSIRKVLKREGK